MNADHVGLNMDMLVFASLILCFGQFFFLEASDLQIVPDSDQHSKAEGGLLDSLLTDFATLPKSPKAADFDEYAVVNVSPSVVPNPYLPTFRIFSYNVTGTSDLSLAPKKKKKK